LSRASAFTLVEVLAVLMLVAIVLPIAMQGVTLSLQTAARARQLTEAGQLASNKLNELVLQKDASYFQGNGTFDENPEYNWESTATERTTGVYELTVRVGYIAQGLEKWVAISTLAAPDMTVSRSTSTIISGGTQ